MSQLRDEAVKIQERINGIAHKKWKLTTVVDELTVQEQEERLALAAKLRQLLDEDGYALADAWVFHWCMNVGADDLHRRAMAYFQKRQALQKG